MSIGVKTKCPSCGYHGCHSIFSQYECRGACHQHQLAVPIDKEEGIRIAEALLERVRSLPG